MRLSSILPPLAAFALAAAGSVVTARIAVTQVEDHSETAVREALADNDQSWASVVGDGLQIVLEGEAPSESVRFRAMTIAGTQVDASRVIDNMSVAEPEGVKPPEFAVEMLRNESGVSLIGLMPASTDREEISDRLSALADEKPLTDLLETANHAPPQGWNGALDFALDALESFDRAKISVSPESVSIRAMVASAEAKQRRETELRQQAPDGVDLTLELTAPRPVISPFTTRFILDDRGARFAACAAGTEEGRARIVEAARSAGLEGEAPCTLGLGAPSRTWPEAVERSLAAIGELGGGTVTLSDADVTLTAPQGTPQEDFDRVVGELENGLPDLFALEATLPEPPDTSPREEGPPEFTARLDSEGALQLRGRVSDALMNQTAENFARARFGSDLTMGTRVAEDPDSLPEGWSVRVLAGLEALSKLEEGALTVRPDTVEVEGITGLQDASAQISSLLVTKLGQNADFEIDVTYEESLDPTAGLPSPQECLEQIASVTGTRKITFDPGSANISGESRAVVDEIADLLRNCPEGLALEIAGYTDSQGRESMNQQLSQERAEAVLRALAQRRIPIANFDAVGYGEENPIADNDTEAGREANRRIEFSLVEPETPEGEEAPEDAEASADEDGAVDQGATGDGSAEEESEGESAEAEGTDGTAAEGTSEEEAEDAAADESDTETETDDEQN